MTAAPWLEARVAGLISALADGAPIDVDAVETAQRASSLRRRSTVGLGWVVPDRHLMLLFAVAALLVTMISGAVVAGGLLRSRDPFDLRSGGPVVEPFIGLPPVGLAPSTPDSGRLVLSFFGRPDSIRLDFHRMWVFADGRLIWTRNLDYVSGFEAGQVSANERDLADALSRPAFAGTAPTTALIEQRLTPEGVDLLRSTVLASGLSEFHPVGPDGPATNNWYRPGVLWGGLLIVQEGQLLEARWTDHLLPRRLADPEAWLPSSAWADPRIGGFVPSRYALCLGRSRPAADVDPEVVLPLLPDDARELVRARAVTLDASSKTDIRCHHEVTTSDARAIAATLEVAGLQRIEPWAHRIAYAIPTREPTRPEDQPLIFFEPMLPDREVVCACG